MFGEACGGHLTDALGAVAGDRPVSDDRYAGGEGLHSRLPRGVVHQGARCRHELRQVLDPAQRQDAGKHRSAGPQSFVLAAQQHREVACAGEQERGGSQPLSHAPGTGRKQHGRPAGAAQRELPRPARRPLARILVGRRGEGRRHDRAAHLRRASGPGTDACRGGLGQAQVQVVAGMEPLPVHGEVGDHDRAGRAVTSLGPQPPCDLSSLVEGGDERIRAPALDDVAQAWLQGCRQRPGARRPAVPVALISAVAEKCRVDSRVGPWAVAERRAVCSAQPTPGAGRQHVEEVHTRGQMAAGPQPPGQFGGHDVVSGAHARADDQNPASHSWIFVASRPVRQPRTGGTLAQARTSAFAGALVA